MAEQEKYLFRAEKISKSFGTVHALKEFDISIKAGEIRGLVGENGSGKSTFSSIVAGMPVEQCIWTENHMNQGEQ